MGRGRGTYLALLVKPLGTNVGQRYAAKKMKGTLKEKGKIKGRGKARNRKSSIMDMSEVTF